MKIITLLSGASGLLFALLLSGCIGHIELDDRLIVQCLGLDFSDGQYVVTAQYHACNAPTQEAGAKPPNFFTAVGRGKSIDHALLEAEINTGKHMLLGECQIFVMGQGLADKDLREMTAFLYKSNESNPSIYIVSTDGDATAEEALEVTYNDESIGTHKMTRMVHNAYRYGMMQEKSLDVVTNDISGTSGATVIPRFYVDKQRLEKQKEGSPSSANECIIILRMMGGRVFKDGRMVGDVDLMMTSTLQFLNGGSKFTTITVEEQDGVHIMDLWAVRSKIIPKVTDGKLHLQIKVSADGEYREEHISPDLLEATADNEKAAEETLEKNIRETLDKVFKEYGTDVIRLDAMLRNKDYKGWEAMKDDFESCLKNCEYEIEADVKLNKYGASAW
jgi:spore germination protein KC